MRSLLVVHYPGMCASISYVNPMHDHHIYHVHTLKQIHKILFDDVHKLSFVGDKNLLHQLKLMTYFASIFKSTCNVQKCIKIM